MGIEKENQNLNQVVGEQKHLLSELERQLHRETIATGLATPGDFAKVSRKLDKDGVMHENGVLRLEIVGLQTEVKQLHAHNDLLLKHLPVHARANVAQELNAQPLPLRDIATMHVL